MTATVRVEPSGITLDVRDGETVMAAARRAGYRWPTICGGLADCGACALEVVESTGALRASSPCCREIDWRIGSSIAKSSRAASATARNIRTGSS